MDNEIDGIDDERFVSEMIMKLLFFNNTKNSISKTGI